MLCVFTIFIEFSHASNILQVKSEPISTSFSPKNNIAYIVSTLQSVVVAYKYDPKNGKLEEIEGMTFNTGGEAPRPPIFSRDGRFIYIVNTLSNSIVVMSVADDGKLNIVQKINESVPLKRSSFSPDGNYFYVLSPEANIILMYNVDKHSGKLSKAMTNLYPAGNIESKYSPSTLSFSQNGKYAYLTNGLSSSINTYDYSSNTGDLILNPERTIFTPTSGNDLFISRDKDSKNLYVPINLGNMIKHYYLENELIIESTLKGVDGVIAPVQVEIYNGYAYINSELENKIYVYIQQSDGSLIPKTDAEQKPYYIDTVVSPIIQIIARDENAFLLATSSEQNSIASYRILDNGDLIPNDVY